jgi:hypothetical protein
VRPFRVSGSSVATVTVCGWVRSPPAKTARSSAAIGSIGSSFIVPRTKASDRSTPASASARASRSWTACAIFARSTVVKESTEKASPAAKTAAISVAISTPPASFRVDRMATSLTGSSASR